MTNYGDRKMLVIDDETRLAESLGALLCGAGYDVRTATSGPDGLAAIRRDHYDLVVTDIRMAEVDGFDIMRHLAAHCPNTGVIVITGHASTDSAIEALHHRVSDYIPKPFDFEMLKRSIERVFAEQEARQLRDDTMHMLSHDIRAPLTNVLGFAQLIESDSLAGRPDGVVAYANVIVSNSQKIITMLDNYLTNARVENNALTLARMPVQLEDLIEEELRLHSLEIAKKRLKIDFHVDQFSADLQGDEPLLTRAFGNLLGNAIKYSPEDDRIEIAAEQSGETVIISIVNSHDSFTDADVAGLFHRFARGKSSRGRSGTGLGLHIVRSIVEAHGGSVGAKLHEKRVAFTMVLPINPAYH